MSTSPSPAFVTPSFLFSSPSPESSAGSSTTAEASVPYASLPATPTSQRSRSPSPVPSMKHPPPPYDDALLESADHARIVRGGRNLRVETLHQRTYHPDIVYGAYDERPGTPSKSKFRASRPLPYFLRRLYPTPLARRIRALSDSPPLWLSLYFLLNLSLTLYNKSVLIHFPFPYTLTALHALCGTIGTFILLRIELSAPTERPLSSAPPPSGVPNLNGKELTVLFLFSILYTINIVVSNASLRLVTVPFHQVVRALTPFFTIVLSAVLLSKRCSRRKLLSLVPVVAGVGFATYGDYYFTALGFFLTLLGTVLAAMKTILTNVILVKPSPTSLPVSATEPTFPSPHARHAPSSLSPSGDEWRSISRLPPNFFSSLFHLAINQLFPPSPTSSPPYPVKSLSSAQPSPLTPTGTGNGNGFRLHQAPIGIGLFSLPKLSLSPLHLLYLLSPLAFIQTTLLAHFTGELDRVRYHLFAETSVATGTDRVFLLLNGVMAFFLNVVSFNANRRVGPLGMSVAANVKQVLTILFAVTIFNLTITPANGVGIVLTLMGGAMYAAVELKEKKEVKRRIG